MDRTHAELTSTECWELLALSSVGRLALSVRALPTILPVRYAIDADAVAIHMGRFGLPAAAVHDSVVAFAVDHIDEAADSGWIVQMQGLAQLARPDGTPTGAGPVAGGQLLRLVPGMLSGQRFTLGSGAPGA